AVVLRLKRHVRRRQETSAAMPPVTGSIKPSSLDPAVVKRAPARKQVDDPVRMPSPAGPGFRCIVRVSEFGPHRRVGARLGQIDRRTAKPATQFCELPLDRKLFGFDLRSKHFRELIVERPKVVQAHRLQLARFHHPLLACICFAPDACYAIHKDPVNLFIGFWFAFSRAPDIKRAACRYLAKPPD
ncbi:hypothetical protein WDZ92_46890, partial [Nostoc sp. NIES-2111]